LLLRSFGVDAVVYLQDELPDRMKSLVLGLEVVHSIPERSFSAAISVDTATRPRIGKCVEKFVSSADVLINIDHHTSNLGWGDINHIDSQASATAEIIASLIDVWAVEPGAAVANLLYAGILEDTGEFRFSNTRPASLRAAGCFRPHWG
ncbi:hypothetical protein BVY02_01440, partial [bacterium J17]